MSKQAKAITAERQNTHGDWDEGAGVSVAVMKIFSNASQWDTLTPGMQEAARMIVHKLHRITTGNPNVKDHWDDIGGYAELISRRLHPPAPIAMEQIPLVQEGIVLNRSLTARRRRPPVRMVLPSGDIVPVELKTRKKAKKGKKARVLKASIGVSLRGAMPKPRTALGAKGIVRAGKPFRKNKASPRPAKGQKQGRKSSGFYSGRISPHMGRG